MSAHADRSELRRWVSGLKKPPRHLFLTHGEEQTALRFAEELRRDHALNVSVPSYREKVTLE